jgi:hypothetical protein
MRIEFAYREPDSIVAEEEEKARYARVLTPAKKQHLNDMACPLKRCNSPYCPQVAIVGVGMCYKHFEILLAWTMLEVSWGAKKLSANFSQIEV